MLITPVWRESGDVVAHCTEMSDDFDSAGSDARSDDGRRLDRLARRAVDSVLVLCRRAMALAGGVLMFAVVSILLGFGLGLAALSDGMRTVWILLGGFFAVVAIWSVISAMWRLRAVRRSADQLVGEMRTLLGGDPRAQRTVIETVEYSEGAQDEGIVVLSRQFGSMQASIGGQVGNFRALGSALRSLTMFPGFMALAAAISFVFLLLSPLFLLGMLL